MLWMYEQRDVAYTEHDFANGQKIHHRSFACSTVVSGGLDDETAGLVQRSLLGISGHPERVTESSRIFLPPNMRLRGSKDRDSHHDTGSLIKQHQGCP